jgi:hypothetical protein
MIDLPVRHGKPPPVEAHAAFVEAGRCYRLAMDDHWSSHAAMLK